MTTPLAEQQRILYCAVADHDALEIADFIGLAGQIAAATGSNVDEVHVQGVHPEPGGRNVIVTLELRCPRVEALFPDERRGEPT